MARRYWLVKSDPGTFSWDDLKAAPARTTRWDGVRNYQARNYLRDDVREGDRALFYHSQTDKAVMGVAKVTRPGHPDPAQFDRKHPGFDPAARPEAPTWYAVDLTWESDFPAPVTLEAMRREPALSEMVLLRKGSRLSVQTVTAEEWKIVVGLATSR